MGPVAAAWAKTQDPELLRAFRHAFCGHGDETARCTCLSAREKALIATWVERSVARGYERIYRPQVRSRSMETARTHEEIYVVSDDAMTQLLFACELCRHEPFSTPKGLLIHVGHKHKDTA